MSCVSLTNASNTVLVLGFAHRILDFYVLRKSCSANSTYCCVSSANQLCQCCNNAGAGKLNTKLPFSEVGSGHSKTQSNNYKQLTNIPTDVHLNTKQLKSIHNYNQNSYTYRITNTHIRRRGCRNILRYIRCAIPSIWVRGCTRAFGALAPELRTAAKPVMYKEAANRYAAVKTLVIAKPSIPATERINSCSVPLPLVTATVPFLATFKNTRRKKEEHDSPIIKELVLDQLFSEMKPIVAKCSMT